MAKKKKYPKRPKQSSSLQVWKNYETKCKDVDKFNSDIIKEAKAKKALIEKISRR